jgi:hypothetical protein
LGSQQNCRVIKRVIVVHTWESQEFTLTGVPPYVKELVDLNALRRESLQLDDKVYKKVMSGVKEYLNGGALVEVS